MTATTNEPSPTAPPATGEVRARASRIVAEIASRLREPHKVVTAATAPDNVQPVSGASSKRRPPWSALSLAEGHPGVALLFAELAHSHAEHRPAVHAHLEAATLRLRARYSDGLFDGLPALAFAAAAARRSPGDYQSLLDHLDTPVEQQIRQRLAAEHARLDAGQPGHGMYAYDIISGASGFGRYLLLREPRFHDLLTETVRYLVRLTEPVRAYGHTVPGWWIPGSPFPLDTPDYPRGHANIGLAHGISGPLALLALAARAGISLPGHDTAMARLADWLLAQLTPEGWPMAVPFDNLITDAPLTDPAARTAWCYGTPGVASALYLAGDALRCAEFQRIALDALDAELDRPTGVNNTTLCHGWAGLLHITWRLAHASDDARLTGRLPLLAARVIDAYEPEAPFGFRYADTGGLLARDRAGFLDGAAGIALALHTYVTDAQPTSSWDAALLLR